MEKGNQFKSKASALRRLYVATFRAEPAMAKLPGAGSDRVYWRMTSDGHEAVVGTYGPDKRENEAFLGLTGVFRAVGINVPRIYADDPEEGVYLQEDLGSRDLLSCLKEEKRIELAAEALKELVKMQTVKPVKWEGLVMHKPFSKKMVMWDLNYFKYDFLKPAGILFDEEALETDFENLSVCLAAEEGTPRGFMYRDFQSRNIMIMDDKPWFIDYQGGRRGPLVYDAVSFLWQVKANFSEEERKELSQIYARELAAATGAGVEEIVSSFAPMIILRTLQVLGAYGFRGLVEKKAHFIESLPGALSNLKTLIEKGAMTDYPELERVCRRCVESRFANRENEDGLTLKVMSFSYKKGYPEDLSGNGGGFMFDCRGMHNPGRYEEYKKLTGLDQPVREFLEERGEVEEFISNAISLVAPSVKTYLRRGFNSLQVGFGCTGGQHRSVYCADGFAKKIKLLFPEARVEIVHREQGMNEILK